MLNNVLELKVLKVLNRREGGRRELYSGDWRGTH